MSDPDFNFFSAYFPSTTDLSNSFDWAISDAIDINSISFSKRNKPFLRFLKTFRDAKVFSGGSPEQLTHLLHVLQQSIRYFASDHERMREEMNAKEAEINSLNQQIKNFKAQGLSSGGNDIYYCPVCMVGFDSYHSVDSHIENNHPTIAEKWKEIRHFSELQNSNFHTLTASQFQPGTKIITQNNVLDTVGQRMHQMLQDNSMKYDDLKKEMNARYEGFVDLLKANNYSSYSNYATFSGSSNLLETEQQNTQNLRRNKKRHSHSQKTQDSEHNHKSSHKHSPKTNSNITESRNSDKSNEMSGNGDFTFS